jgi:hypothetical protein
MANFPRGRVPGSENTPVHGAVDDFGRTIRQAAGIPGDVVRKAGESTLDHIAGTDKNIRGALGDIFGFGKKPKPKPRPRQGLGRSVRAAGARRSSTATKAATKATTPRKGTGPNKRTRQVGAIQRRRAAAGKPVTRAQARKMAKRNPRP